MIGRLFHLLWPQSLRPRLILLVLGTALVAQAATITALSHYQRSQIGNATIDLISTTIRTLRASLGSVPANEREDFVHTASDGQWRLVERPPLTEAQRAAIRARRADRPDDPSLRDSLLAPSDIRASLRPLIRRLNAHLGDDTRVGLSRGADPEIYISLTPRGPGTDVTSIEWLVVPLARIDPPVATPLVVAWLGGLGAVLLVALGFSWHISRPITHLAQAADRLAAGAPERVEPAGPRETRLLGERFNAMLDALAESESVRRTLLAGLPHDLKAPLARMWLRVEMSDDPALRDGLRKDLQDMQHMVDQFISYVRGSDPNTYRFAPIALAEWLNERTTSWRDAGSDVRLELSDQGNDAHVAADPVALARLLDNLIGNALTHGAPPVEVSLTVSPGHAHITVADHGAGIAADRREEALRPFVRLDDARTRTGNVGLGLAMVDTIARAHGGQLVLGQTAAGGLSAVATLPLADATDAVSRENANR